MNKSIRRALDKNDMQALALALTPRMRLFCEEYINDFNGTAACLRAGYAPKWADRQAHLLMKNPGVAAYIDHLSRSKEQRIISVNPEYVIQKVTAIVTKPDAKDSDKLRGLELLARHLGMFIDRTEISGPDGEAIEIKKTAEDAADFVRSLRQLADRSDEKKVVTLD